SERMSDVEDSANPASSALGTKEYWDAHYSLELGNYEESQDEGEIWFGKQAETRAVQYILGQSKEKKARVLDFGCGNGHFLRRLRSARSDWAALHGTDYSEPSIDLCRKIEEEQREEGQAEIEYTVFDILSESSLATLANAKFDFVHDKGTWDAISLSDDRSTRLVAYRNALAQLLIAGGQFVIVSCNYTTTELRDFFSVAGLLQFECELPAAAAAATAAFSFGGKTGAPFHTAVFSR
ncbi:hypothetical protein PFISCL1PPCAC_17172, partial [Pristionchus fissidentatus]